MSKTKIVLSAKELDMVKDSEWILTKHHIIKQVYVLLESIITDIDIHVLPRWEAVSGHPSLPPRIFKGENYLGLPYVTLDHPRLFESENILAVRTMFWWGNFVSLTLHAAGIYKEEIFKRIEGLDSSEKNPLHVCIHENQWHHYFEPDNYIRLKDLSVEQWKAISSERNFIKVAYKLKLRQFNELQHDLITHYKMLAEILA